MMDDFDEDDELQDVGHEPIAVRDPGGVPRSLTPTGYRSVSPAVGVAGLGTVALVVGAVMWMVVSHPHATAAATPVTIVHSQDPSTTTQTLVPDPTPTQLGQLRSRPVYSIVSHPARPSSEQATVSAQSSMMVAAPTQGTGYAEPAPPSAAQNTAKLDAQRIADAQRASSVMPIDGSDAQSAPNAASGGAANYPTLRAPAPDAPTGTSAAQAAARPPESSEFASDGDGHGPPHGAFIAQHNGTPGYEAATSRYELVAGTIIPARLVTAIDSTTSGGMIKAQVVEPIYDSATHSVVVVPRGTIVLGQTDSARYGEARLVASWTELYLPNGRKFFAAGNEGAGLKGEAGMSASVDTHAGRAFGSALVNAALQAGVTLASRASTLVDVSTTTSAVQSPQRQAPTLHAYPGQLFNIVLNHDLPLDRYVPAAP